MKCIWKPLPLLYFLPFFVDASRHFHGAGWGGWRRNDHLLLNCPHVQTDRGSAIVCVCLCVCVCVWQLREFPECDQVVVVHVCLCSTIGGGDTDFCQDSPTDLHCLRLEEGSELCPAGPDTNDCPGPQVSLKEGEEGGGDLCLLSHFLHVIVLICFVQF